MLRIVAFVFVVSLDLAVFGGYWWWGPRFTQRAQTRLHRYIEGRYHVTLKYAWRNLRVERSPSPWVTFKIQVLLAVAAGLIVAGPLLLAGLASFALVHWFAHLR